MWKAGKVLELTLWYEGDAWKKSLQTNKTLFSRGYFLMQNCLKLQNLQCKSLEARSLLPRSALSSH